MSTEIQMASWQKQMQIVMPIVMTVVTALQPASLQLYFVCSAILGGTTAQLLRAPAFRRLAGLSMLPSRASNEVYSRVAKGEIKPNALRNPNGSVRYQAPNASRLKTSASKKAPSIVPYTSIAPALNIKSGITLPRHIVESSAPAKVPQKYADRDHDFERGARSGSFRDRWDWVKRNYSPRYVWRRTKRWLNQDSRSAGVMMQQDRKKKAQEATRRYAMERKRQMQAP
jgi:YidC/Oxa1 family membrane protein insertase